MGNKFINISIYCSCNLVNVYSYFMEFKIYITSFIFCYFFFEFKILIENKISNGCCSGFFQHRSQFFTLCKFFIIEAQGYAVLPVVSILIAHPMPPVLGFKGIEGGTPHKRQYEVLSELAVI